MTEEFKMCPKRRYETFRDALDKIEEIKEFDPDVNLRVYKCHTCHNYHLTSKQFKGKVE